ncbi:MAG: DUF1186 domain-containing protein [Clostridiales bacterium]|jgi:hypothetical protein|nr:DUF1186 domain-containing protein [Clostridiales bacterium]
MTKQEVLNSIRDFSKTFPKKALKEIIANPSEYIPELLESRDYALNNAKEIRETKNDYFMHSYAMYLLAQFREKRAFPKLAAFLRLPEREINCILGDSLTEHFSQLLLSTFDNENTQILLDIMQDCNLYEWARLVAIETYGLLCINGFISQDEVIKNFRALIYEKLPSDDSYVVFTGIVGGIIDCRLYDMVPDARFLYDDDRVDEFVYGGYDDFLDWIFNEEHRRERTFIDDAISEMETWACFKQADEGSKKDSKKDSGDLKKMIADMEKEIMGEAATEQKRKKVGRNDPCPCGSGKKYKKCCIDKEQTEQPVPTVTRIEDRYDLLKLYPKDSELFNQMYEKEAVEIDKLAYKALRHRAIPMWIKRDYEQERLGKLNYLNEALGLFLDKCQREQITSFDSYDKKYMVHYASLQWVSAIVDLVKDGDTDKVASIRQKAESTLKKFS